MSPMLRNVVGVAARAADTYQRRRRSSVKIEAVIAARQAANVVTAARRRVRVNGKVFTEQHIYRRDTLHTGTPAWWWRSAVYGTEVFFRYREVTRWHASVEVLRT